MFYYLKLNNAIKQEKTNPAEYNNLSVNTCIKSVKFQLIASLNIRAS
ncbi:hypothetical protein [Mucilaginibacter sp. UR6-11]|nr:hypothetical protein [Mucilaginibacter sp. UR6-11]